MRHLLVRLAILLLRPLEGYWSLRNARRVRRRLQGVEPAGRDEGRPG